jgi:hypothetical protein
MTKQLAMAFGLGAILPLVGALYCGGENLAQAGLRLAAIEQGFALASTHWQFQATPAQQLELARWDEPQPAPAAAKKPKAAAPAKRR